MVYSRVVAGGRRTHTHAPMRAHTHTYTHTHTHTHTHAYTHTHAHTHTHTYTHAYIYNEASSTGGLEAMSSRPPQATMKQPKHASRPCLRATRVSRARQTTRAGVRACFSRRRCMGGRRPPAAMRRYSLYLLYWYQSTHADAEALCC
jgi:hypothetical protein